MQKLQNGSFGIFPKLPYEIRPGNPKKEFEQIYAGEKPLLTTESKYLEFCGLPDNDDACVHVALKNPTNKTILFNITTPDCPALFVKPHVGMVEPGKSTMIYCVFKGKKVYRIPPDYCWYYAIYHISISDKDAKWIKEDEFTSGNLRRIWIDQGSGDINNILLLSSVFPKDKKPLHECKSHKKFLDRGLHLTNEGEVYVVQDSKGEASNTPAKNAGSSRKLKKTMSSSDTTDELPKTAEN